LESLSEEADIENCKKPAKGEALSTRALLNLLSASARLIAGRNDAVACVWEAGDRGFATSVGTAGHIGGLNCRLSAHPEVISALERGEDVSLNDCVLLPIAMNGRLEGVLSIALTRPFDGEMRGALQEVCESAALVIAGLRERNEAIQLISKAAHELEIPLAAARGFARMALEDIRSAPATTHGEYVSLALRNIDRLGEVAVGLLHASAYA
jgi:signal transduction histidine kinase